MFKNPNGKICISNNNVDKDQKRYCYWKYAPDKDPNAPRPTYLFALDFKDQYETKDQSDWSEFNSLAEMQNYLLNMDPSRINPDFPSHYFYQIFDRDYLAFTQDTNDLVGGIEASDRHHIR